MLHSPQSTPNSVTYLETGVVPLQYEIHKRQLNFLHHILMLEADDPVKQMYQQLLKYPFEANWSNEIMTLREKYELHQTDEDVSKMKRNTWKRLVKKTVHKTALKELNDETKSLKKFQLPEYQKLAVQKYLVCLRPQEARTIFQMRAGVIDLKTVRPYQYTDSTCRLCKQNDEDIRHVVNQCPEVTRTHHIDDILTTTNTRDLEEIATRYLDFASKLSEIDAD